MANDTDREKPPGSFSMHGVRYQVTDVARAAAFYTDHLGFRLGGIVTRRASDRDVQVCVYMALHSPRCAAAVCSEKRSPKIEPGYIAEWICSVRRMLERLPYCGVFDYLVFRVERGTVTSPATASKGG